MAEKDELDHETDYDDDIRESIEAAFSNAEGHCSPKYLRYELRKRGLQITNDVPVAWRLVMPITGVVYALYPTNKIAAKAANYYGYRMEPLYAAIS